jgi:DNA-binding NarL/FixJ family response regulator
MRKIRLLVIEDNIVLREGLKNLIDEQGDMKVVSAIGSGKDVLIKVREKKPQLILMDINAQNDKRTPLVKCIRKEYSGIKIIGMSFISLNADIARFVKTGAYGFISKGATDEEFLNVIRSAAQEINYFPSLPSDSPYSQIIESALRNGGRTISKPITITKLERKILTMIAEDRSNREITRQLTMTTSAINGYLKNILTKLVFQNRMQLTGSKKFQN